MILLRQRELIKEKKELERKLRQAPAGVLTCHRRGETYKWYHSHKAKFKIFSVCNRFDFFATIQLTYS